MVTTELVDGLVEGRTEDGGERALLLRLVRGFERGESSRWAMTQIEGFTSDLQRQGALMSATIDLINTARKYEREIGPGLETAAARV